MLKEVQNAIMNLLSDTIAWCLVDQLRVTRICKTVSETLTCWHAP